MNVKGAYSMGVSPYPLTWKMARGFFEIFSHIKILYSYLLEKSVGTVTLEVSEPEPECFKFRLGVMEQPFIDEVVMPFVRNWEKTGWRKLWKNNPPIELWDTVADDPREYTLFVPFNKREKELYETWIRRTGVFHSWNKIQGNGD